MNSAQTLSFLFLLVSVGQISAEVTCPEVSDGEEIFLPSKTNCEEYFHCANGVPVEMKCR